MSYRGQGSSKGSSLISYADIFKRKLRQQEIGPKIVLALMNPYIQWIIINCVAWSLGLYATALCIKLFGIAGALVGGLVTGSIVGISQAWLIRRLFPIASHQWVGWSALAGVLGIMLTGMFFVI